jgi:hypothetical protein
VPHGRTTIATNETAQLGDAPMTTRAV